MRGQMLVPSETESQTKQDVTCIWSVQVRQGEKDWPGRSAVRPTPNCVPSSSGHTIFAGALQLLYARRDR
jgi:hypothetical protein